MSSIPPEITDRAKAYCEEHSLIIETRLGNGIQGVVYSTQQKTAIKIFLRHIHYQTERNVYQRLKKKNFSVVDGFNIPRLVDFSDALKVVEMEIVNPPYILDFAGAYLDTTPPYDAEQLEEWENERIEMFGDDWPRIRAVRSKFKGIGITLMDVKPGNITIRD